jgi:hypothetical protein
MFARWAWEHPGYVLTGTKVRVLFWPPISRSYWAQPATVFAARKMRALLGPLFSLSVWAKAATVVASTTGEGAALVCFCSVGVGSASHCFGGHDR